MPGKKLTLTEVQQRVEDCFNLRYQSDTPITQKVWIEYCHNTYGDKSEQQYCHYWALAKEKYDNGWKERLNKLLNPATEELERLLLHEDEKIRQRVIDQVYKYTGNDIQKVQQDITQTINVSFDTEE